MNNIGENIRKFRMYMGYSQKELGDKIGRTGTVISNWENGVHCPDLETTEQLCYVLNVTPNQMLGWEENVDVEQFYEKKASILIEIEKLNSAKDKIDERISKYKSELKKRI